MTFDFKKGPQGLTGLTGPPGPAEISGVPIDATAIAGLAEGDTVAFKCIAGVLVPFLLVDASTHKLTAGNGDFVHLNAAP